MCTGRHCLLPVRGQAETGLGCKGMYARRSYSPIVFQILGHLLVLPCIPDTVNPVLRNDTTGASNTRQGDSTNADNIGCTTPVPLSSAMYSRKRSSLACKRSAAVYPHTGQSSYTWSPAHTEAGNLRLPVGDSQSRAETSHPPPAQALPPLLLYLCHSGRTLNRASSL